MNLARLRRLLAVVEDLAGVLVLVAILGVMSVAVVRRYLLADSLIWAEELTRFGLVVLTFAGVAVGLRNQSHIRIDMVDHLPAPLPAIARGLATAVTVLVLGFLAVQAVRIMPFLSSQLSAAMQLPMAWLYAAVAAALVLGLLRLAMDLLAGRRR